jgi:hypothetical protein
VNQAGVKVYLDREERAALERQVVERGASQSYVMRLGLRLLVGLAVPRDELDRARELHGGRSERAAPR